jgi:CubicO group peptidase (beta-lactamase class C family)
MENAMELVKPEELGFSSSRLARIKPFLEGAVERKQYAGFLSLAARRGKVVHLEKCGWMDIESGAPMQFDTLFRIYSMTKPITTSAVMMLFEEGRIRLRDDVSDYIPAFKDTRVYQVRNGSDFDLVPQARPMSIHDLLTHTAGLSYGFDEKSYVDDLYRKSIWQRMDKGADLDLETVILEVAKLPLAHQPGTAWRYSMATDVLGYLVQVVSGKSFDVYLKERIFDPLGMVDTGFTVPPEKVSRLATVYNPDKQGGLTPDHSPMITRFTRPTRNFSGGGGLVSSLGDYFRFAQMLLNGGVLEGQRLLGRKTVESMLMNHLPQGINPDDPASGFGLGGSVLLDVAHSQNLGSPGIWGWGGAANTKFWIDPKEEVLGLLMLQFMPGFLHPIDQDYQNLVYQSLVD